MEGVGGYKNVSLGGSKGERERWPKDCPTYVGMGMSAWGWKREVV